MARKKIKLKKNWMYILISIVIGIMSIFNPIFFLFMISLLVYLFIEEKKRKLIYYIILVLVLSSFPGVLINYKYEMALNRPFSIANGLKAFLMDVYNIIKYNMIESDLGNIKTMQEPKVIENFELYDLKNFYLSKEHINKVKVSLDPILYYTDNTSIKISIDIPIDSPLLLTSIPLNKDWEKYNFVNLWIRSNGFKGMFEFILVDNDGDWWHYYDKDVLKKQEWTIVKMPLKSFNNPWWTQHGNKKQDFDEIAKYIIKITPDGELIGNYSVNIDEIYLSDI